MPRALCRLREHLVGWQVVHQAGDGQLQHTEQRYQQASVDALVVAFIDELATLVTTSDLVVCRAGGTALAELALAGVPAILVPSPSAMDYQWPNAEVYSSAGAASIIDETEDSGTLDEALFADLKRLLSDPSRRKDGRQYAKDGPS